jgi:two-component system, NarL family, invasion response regulator UvrY
MKETTVAIVDDHKLLRKSLALLIESFTGYKVLFEADEGRDFIARLPEHPLPDIVLLDINMPGMDGYATAKWIRQRYPAMKVVILSMMADEGSVLKMIQIGANGYILKYIEAEEFAYALNTVQRRGYYYSDTITANIFKQAIQQDESVLDEIVLVQQLTPKEKAFLKYTATELSYKEIAEIMGVGARTVDRYRDILFGKLRVKTRMGLALFALRNELV